METIEKKANRQLESIKNTVFAKLFIAEYRKRVLIAFYQALSNLIIDALIIALLIILVIGTVKIFVRLPANLSEDFFSLVFHSILNDVMVVFIFVELFRVLIEYFKEERVKITYIADATLVFTFKEIWVRFSEPDFDALKILAMGGTMLAVAAVRTMAVIYSPDRNKE